MKLGDLDIIGDPGCDKLRLRVGPWSEPTEIKSYLLTADQTERLITYLKGLRDGMGWNHKAAADRSL